MRPDKQQVLGRASADHDTLAREALDRERDPRGFVQRETPPVVERGKRGSVIRRGAGARQVQPSLARAQCRGPRPRSARASPASGR